MNRMTTILATLTLLLGWTQWGLAQDLQTDPAREIVQLIAWTQMQNPQPTPQPRPDPTPVPHSPDVQQPGDGDVQHQHSLQTLTGTVVREDGKYVLRAADSKTYQIDDQERARQYEGKLVKIVGSIEKSTNTIQVQSIELMS
jgi:Protein of unknown function (DUF5818)